MYCLRLFVVVLQELHYYTYYCGVFIEKYVYTKFHLNWLLVSELYGHLCPYLCPYHMYCLRLFNVVLHCLPKCLHVCIIRVRGCYHITKFCYSIPYGF